jgi:hypothetical protein
MPSEWKMILPSSGVPATARARPRRRSQRGAIARAVAMTALVLAPVPPAMQGASATLARQAISPAESGAVTLGTRGVGSVRFGMARTEAVRRLREVLGAPTGQGINTGCGPSYREVAWKDFIAEFHLGRFSGYRYIVGGYPVDTKGSPRDRVSGAKPVPSMSTAPGITLGDNLAELHSRYKKLRRSGAASWTAPSGLTFVVGSDYRSMAAGTDHIVEIKIGTCGAF